MRLDEYELNRLQSLVAGSSYEEGLKLIYTWIKQGKIGLADFKTLVEYNRDCCE